MKKLQCLFTGFIIVVFSVVAIAMPMGEKGVLHKNVDAEFLQKANVQSVDQFLTLTPKVYKEITGERLTIKETLKLKAAQKVVGQITSDKPDSPDIPQVLYVVLAILGFGWLVMGILDGFSGNNWWINLILTFLCYIPGLIHALVKMDEYY